MSGEVEGKVEDWLPEGNVAIQTINQKDVHAFGLCLFDSGASSTLINKRLIPNHIIPIKGRVQKVTTTQGTYQADEYAEIDKIYFPDFTASRQFENRGCMLFNSPQSRYDL